MNTHYKQKLSIQEGLDYYSTYQELAPTTGADPAPPV